MSGYQSFTGFCNAMKTGLEGSGITVTVERGETNTPPYLFMEDGPEAPHGEWQSARMCQGSLVLEADPTQASLQVRMGRAIDTVLAVSKRLGMVEIYDYTVDPAVKTGYCIPKYFELSPELSRDPNRSRKVITWVLYGRA